MKIIYHHRTQGTGAEGVHIASIVRELRALGHVVDVVSPSGREPESTAGQSPYAPRRGLAQRAFAFLSRSAPQLMFEFAEIAYNLSAYAKLRRSLRSQRGTTPTLLYERYAFFLFAGALLARRHGLVYLIEVNEVAGEPRVRSQHLVALSRAVERRVLRQADGVVVVSPYLKQKITARGVPSDRVHVIPNGVDERRFQAKITPPLRERFGIGPSDLVIGFVGWFVDWHNLPMLVRTFAAVAKGRACKLLLVGDGVLKQELQALSTQLEIGQRVIFAGAIPYEDVPRAIATMDVCVIPESNSYRSPIKLFEYMAMGKAVLAPDYEPIRSVVRDGVDASIFRAGNEQDFADKLANLIEDSPLRVRLGTQAVETVISSHLWRHNAERALQIYEQARAQKQQDTTGRPEMAGAWTPSLTSRVP